MVEVVAFTIEDLMFILFALLVCMIFYAIIKIYFEDKRFEKDNYKRLENYRERYGFTYSCEELDDERSADPIR